MPVTNLDVASAYIGVGSYSYPVSAWPGGAVLFVNSATGLDNRGRVTFMGTPASVGAQPSSAQGPFGDPNKPLATVFGANGALSFCKAGRGDLIIVAPGHSENVAAATNVLGGVSIVGIGYGSIRPKIVFTAAASALNSNGAGVQLQNIILDMANGGANVTLGMTIAHSGWQLIGVRIVQSVAANQATQAIKLSAGADDFLFLASEIDAETAGPAIGIGNLAANAINRPIIAYSYIHGNFSTAPISLLTTTNIAILIEYNTIVQRNAATTVIQNAAGNTVLGIVSYNDLFSASAALHTTFLSGGLGTGMGYIQNFGSSGTAGMNGKSAILIPDAGAIP